MFELRNMNGKVESVNTRGVTGKCCVAEKDGNGLMLYGCHC